MCDDQEFLPDDEMVDELQEEFVTDHDQPVILICTHCMAENEEVKLRSVQNKRCWNCGSVVDQSVFILRA